MVLDMGREALAGENAMQAKSPGQIAYEADLARHPLYDDGSSRPSWDALARIFPEALATWERNSTPREYSTP